jgi:ketosteroid isomerase-like protein
MQSFDMGDAWLEVVDPGSPAWLVEWVGDAAAAYRAGDVDWLLNQTDPEIEVVQPSEIPGARSYHGPEAQIDALLDWPLQWEHLSVEPTRVYALDDGRAIVVATHRGRSRQVEIDVEAEVVWLFTFRDDRVRRWDMYMSLEAALEAAESG